MKSNLSTSKALWLLAGFWPRVFDGVVQDVRQRYVGSVFGSLWAGLYPLLQLIIYAVLFTLVFRIRPPGMTEMSYVVLVFSGLVGLLSFSEVLSAATSSLSANKSTLLNTVFPAELIPVRAAIAAQVPSLFGLLVTVAAGFIWGKTTLVTLLFVPVFWILLFMFAIGIGWMFSLLSLVARDIQHGLGLVTMLLFVLSPYAYTPEMVPPALKMIIYLNPLSYFVLTFQALICYGTWPSPIAAGGAVLLGLTSFVLGFRIFHKSKHVFFDYA